MILSLSVLLFLLAIAPDQLVHAEAKDEPANLYQVTSDHLNMRTNPDIEAAIIGQLVAGNKLRVFEEKNGWYKTFFDSQPVWVASQYLLLLEETSVEATSDAADETKTKAQETKEPKESAQSVTEEEPPTYSLEHATEGIINLPQGFLKANDMQISENAIVVTKDQLEGHRILVDAGHGGKDSGATNDGVYEKNLTLLTAEEVAEQLESEGATVQFTRNNDTFISLEKRVNQSNTENIDAFISFHYDYFNDPAVNGINTYYYNEKTSAQLAKEIHAALMENVAMNDRGVRHATFYVLKNNTKPAILLELGFMTNPENLKKIQTEEYRKSVAKAITDGLVDYFDAK